MRLILVIIFTLSSYTVLFSQGRSSEIVDLQELIPRLKLNVKYATRDNFTGQRLYPVPKAFGTIPVANALQVIGDSLAQEGTGIMVYDVYRPRIIQYLLWEVYPVPGYVANPATGSRHNRGAAVDLTLYDLATGKELEMPTPFDEFSERAHHDYENLSDEVKRNRAMLKDIMTKHGFSINSMEWWHYEHTGSSSYPLKDFQMR
jgi:D-alanyl-D-alanine dipeptidase